MIGYNLFNINMKLIILTFLQLIFTMFLSFPLSSALAYSETPEAFDRGDIAEIFDFGSGIFAALLCGLSLVAYKKIKLKRILFVSIAFGLFAIRTIVSHFDLFVPEVESSIIEMILAIMTFVALSLFFIAIVRKEKVFAKSKLL
jgi:hypothetical protein